MSTSRRTRFPKHSASAAPLEALILFWGEEMKRVPSLAVGVATVVVLVVSLSARTQASEILLGSTGTAVGGLGNNPFAISWTQADTWTNVSISLTLSNLCAESLFNFCEGTSTGFGDVYVTNAIGVGTTAATNQIGFASVPTSGIVFSTLTPFSGLTLAPGSYYLVYSRQSLGLGWAFASTIPVVTGPDVTVGPGYLGAGGSIVSGYAPATGAPYFTFAFGDFNTPVFAITGDRASENPAPVPEPTSLLLMGTGLIFSLRSLHRRRP